MVTPFQHQVYTKLLEVPSGKVTTYRDLAHAIGTKAYRAVGMALNKNPFAPRVPCHRVVNNDGSIGGFATGSENKIKLLKCEGIRMENGKIADFEKVRFAVFGKKGSSSLTTKQNSITSIQAP